MHRDAVKAAVHGRAHQVIEARVDQREVTLGAPVDRMHLRDQHAGLGDQEAARFDFQADIVAQILCDALACRIPLFEVVVAVDARFAFTVGNRQPAARRDGLDVVVQRFHHADHGVAHAGQMAVVDAGADVHVNADQLEPMAAHDGHRLGHIVDPYSVLALRAARVGLVAVAMAKTRVDAQPHPMAWGGLADTRQHVQRTCIYGDVVLEHGGKRGVVDQVRGEDDAFGLAARLEAGGQAAFDLSQ
ncbi:hypothetical protein D3C72_1169160 [compost metagenome]